MAYKKKKLYNKKPKSDNNLKKQKKAKIIVRNLPFKNLSEKSFEELFKEYGDIVEVKLLKKDDGKFVGCGFIQFKTVSSAAKAIRHGNQKEVLGRKVIVDWALPKDVFLKKAQEVEKALNSNDIKQEVSSEDEKDVKFYIDKTPDKCNNVKDENDSDDDEDDEDDNEKYENNESESDYEDDGSSCEETNNEVKKNFQLKKNNSQNQENKPRSNDVEEKKTVFVRNVPYSATNEDLQECFQSYGSIEYALICVDKLTEHSKGTAFVKFKDKESALKCLKDSNKIYLHDNPLIVTIALSKDNLDKNKTAKKTAKDSRNLYLVREGVIVAGSKSALGVSATDMAKRLQLEQWKSQILKNLNMIVSKTRLVIHNLPASYDDAKLKNLFSKHSNPKAIVKEAKVMRDKKKLDGNGNGKSKEIGFVSFTNHEDALVALRNINNNPNIFTAKRRPIVAFSIENRAVLNTKQKRIEKSRAKLGVVIDPKLSKLNRKQRRFIRRRQKIIEKRKEAKKAKESQMTNVEDKKNVEKVNSKRKISEQELPRKKLKSNTTSQEPESNQFSGLISEPGKKIKFRSRKRLRTQANIHHETLKKERRKKREKNKKMEIIKQEKQKKGKPKLMDDAKLSNILKKYREGIQKSSECKKWYDK